MKGVINKNCFLFLKNLSVGVIKSRVKKISNKKKGLE